MHGMKIFVIYVSEQNIHVKAESVAEAIAKTREHIATNSCTIKLGLEHSFEYAEGDKYDIG
jgi:hypothetical protein